MKTSKIQPSTELKPAPAWTCGTCGTPEVIRNGGTVCPKCTSKKGASFRFSSGLVLMLPRLPFASMLFLEFVRDYYEREKIQLSFRIYNSTDTENYFCVRMDHALRQTYIDAVDYINDNLPG
jgi:hypothetical protein